MNRIVGYTDRPSVEPGGKIGCHVSLLSESPTARCEYQARIVRIIGREEGGAERVEPIPGVADRRGVATVESTATGSYAIAAVALDGGPAPELQLELTFMPTLFDGREQALISVSDLKGKGGRLEELTLALDAARRPVLTLGGDAGARSRFVLPCPVSSGHWYRMRGGFREGEAFAAVDAVDDPEFAAVSWTWLLAAAPEIGQATVLIAARPVPDGTSVSFGSNFTGRIERPRLSTGEDVLARWDLGRDPGSFRIHDSSGNDNHGELFGLPMRSVTGSNWDGTTSSPAEARDQYGAIHFFADAIEDAGWPKAFSFDVPADLRPGLYGVVLECEDDHEVIPFVVSPPASDRADILIVLPTATYMAYANTRFTWEKVNWEVQRERSVELGRGERILLEHPEFGASSYDQYLDGSDVTYISWRRPNLDIRSTQSRGEAYPCDLHLVDWLERRGYRYDVCSDDDLDRGGTELLGSYRVAVTGTHPEYISTRSCAAFESFLSGGGRLAVLGGDIYTWRVAFAEERPWIMEVRKPGNRTAGTRPGAEGHLALTDEPAGMPGRPRPAERFLGTSTASMGFDAPRPYERLPDSDRPEAAFIFAGVESRVIGDDSLAGGVAFQEWDNTEDVSGFVLADGKPIVLARSTGHSVTTRWFGAGKRRNHAEMTYFVTSGGGAVFSASSMAWCLCLDRDDVSQITTNVLERFLDPLPLEHPQPTV